MQTEIRLERLNNRNFLNYVKNDYHRFNIIRCLVKNNQHRFDFIRRRTIENVQRDRQNHDFVEEINHLKFKIRELEQNVSRSQSWDFRIKFFSRNERLNYVFRKKKRFQSLFNHSSQNLHRKSKNYRQFMNDHYSMKKIITFRDRILRSQDVMMYDSNKHFVEFFIRRFQQITVIEKSRVVFRVFSLCLNETTFEWHNKLFFFTQQKMNSNLIVWASFWKNIASTDSTR